MLSPKTLAIRAALEACRRLVCREDWNIGVVDQPAADILRRGIVGEVRWLPKPAPWTILADPACRSLPDGGRTLFVEHLDYRIGRGEIWAADLPPGRDPAEACFGPLQVASTHLSYPFPFLDDRGRWCLTAENWEAGGAPLWREAAGAWQPAGQLFGGRPVVDPTLWRAPDRWWLFCTFQDEAPNARLQLFHAPAPEGPWTPHPANPVKTDPSSARPAGPLFVVDGTLIRPAQDCSRSYGAAVVLNAVRRLDAAGFREEPVRRLEPVRGPFPHGLHSFCPAGEVTLIDGKRWRAHPLELARKLLFGLRARQRRRASHRHLEVSTIASKE